MHLLSIIVTSILATGATASPSHLRKRCTPVFDQDLALGYYPPAPCWQEFDPSCQPYIRTGTEMTVDAKHKLAVVFGVSKSCAAEVAEELAREADGRKNYGWVREHGELTLIKGGILVISNMSDDTVKRYRKLTYYSERTRPTLSPAALPQ
ncbi:hypothetical protein B0H66DRAFT_569225 [Apodospora peruviana]|uniref:Uncharacterized protein n=1 Tax=Apodospora peruviana TaxID=516989 RepID=A0AAE0HUH5_9PEZI|nr:hypothetical protein B0H66DRAFT_569225 [Apodospora peruviana]